MIPRVLAICSHKGGVGKTTIAANLADVLGRNGLRVLLVDLDPQGNATAAVGLGADRPPFTITDVLASRDRRPGVLLDAVNKAGDGWFSIEVVPADLRLESLQVSDQGVGRERRLRKRLAEVWSRWDVVVIDCPSSLGLLTVNALVAATDAVLVTEPGAASVEGLAGTFDLLRQVQEDVNPELRVAGIVVNRYQKRSDAAGWLVELRELYPGLVLDPPVSEREAVRRAATTARPLSFFDRDEGAGRVYGQLAELATVITTP